jgi:hypothetical protein
MSWISIIIFALRYLPEAISIVKSIFDLITKVRDKRVARVELKKLRENMVYAKAGDLSPLREQLSKFNGIVS